MATYTIEINEQQMALIERAMKALRDLNSIDQRLEEEDAEELDILIGLVDFTREEESKDPGVVHGWCY
jgi:hypothetical protein